MGLYPQQRRRERYQAIYVWKILEKLGLDPTSSLLHPKLNPHTEPTCERQTLSTHAPQRIKTLLASSLSHNSPVILNALPKKIRNLTGCSVDKFKRELDNFLRMLPDEPTVLGYTANCTAASKLMPDQLRLRHQDLRDDSSGGPPQL